jgi:carboxylesterase
MPYNGLSDVGTNEHSRLTAGKMRQYADEVIDIAAGLGDRMIVVGFSAGGVLSAWIAQNRTEPDFVVTVSPALGVTSLPPRVSRFLARMFPALPDFRIPIKASTDPPLHAYTAYSSRGLGEMLRLSEAVFQQAERMSPKSKRLLAVVNPTDPAVSESTFRHLIGLWTRTAPTKVTVRTFRSELGLSHDIIDPAQPKQRIDVVYPALTHWIRTLCCADQ